MNRFLKIGTIITLSICAAGSGSDALWEIVDPKAYAAVQAARDAGTATDHRVSDEEFAQYKTRANAARAAHKGADKDTQVSCRMALRKSAPYGINIGGWVVPAGPVLIADADLTNAFGTERRVRAGCVVEDGIVIDVFAN